MRSTRSSTSSSAPAVRRGLGVALTTGALALSLLPAGVAAAAASPAVAQVRVKVADQAAVVLTTTPRAWPKSMLTDNGVEVDGNDLVRVVRDGRRMQGAKRRLRDGDTVKVVDVRRRTLVKRASIAPRTVTVSTTRLKPGQRKVTTRGTQGVRRVKIVKKLHNGDVVKRRVASSKVIRAQKPRRVLVGRAAYSVPGADGLNWAGLANCESGGNPRAVNAAGYYGLYQFNVATWRSVGGSGMPHHASPAAQTYRAKLLYKSRGRSPWPHCGRYL